MENNCSFVCSRGILKSCVFHSPHPQSSWCYDTNYLIEMIHSNNMFDKMSIYVCTDVLPFFLYEILPRINNTFYLISGDSDATVPNGGIDIYHNPRKLEHDVCMKILNHPKLIKWFAQNCIYKKTDILSDVNDCCIFNNSKITQLPIGLDYHTISNDPNKFWRDENEGSSPEYQEMILKNIRATMKPFYNRNKKIFVNMSMGDTDSCNRRRAFNSIPSELIHLNANKMPRTQVWKEIIEYSFCLSPYGAGPDCHRHWEILCLGSIPIIQSLGSNEMFEDLPVLIIEEWSDINEKLLEDTIEKFKNQKFNYDKLLLRYWVDQFSL